MLSPANPRSAGSSVIDAARVVATVIALASPIEATKSMPMR
jgi:hypothetical protein